MKRKILVAIGVLLLLAGLAVLLYPTAKTSVLRGKERDSIEAFILYLETAQATETELLKYDSNCNVLMGNTSFRLRNMTNAE